MKYEHDTEMDKIPTLDSDRRNDPWRDCPGTFRSEVQQDESFFCPEGSESCGFDEQAIGSDLKRAGKLTKSAAKDKQKAINSRATVKYELEKLTQVNDDIDSVVDAFNSRTRRMRQSGKTQSS